MGWKTPTVIEPIGEGESGRFSFSFLKAIACFTACILYSHSRLMLRAVDSRLHTLSTPQIEKLVYFLWPWSDFTQHPPETINPVPELCRRDKQRQTLWPANLPLRDLIASVSQRPCFWKRNVSSLIFQVPLSASPVAQTVCWRKNGACQENLQYQTVHFLTDVATQFSLSWSEPGTLRMNDLSSISVLL